MGYTVCVCVCVCVYTVIARRYETIASMSGNKECPALQRVELQCATPRACAKRTECD